MDEGNEDKQEEHDEKEANEVRALCSSCHFLFSSFNQSHGYQVSGMKRKGKACVIHASFLTLSPFTSLQHTYHILTSVSRSDP